jgi:DNA repair protein RecN (Recombination protein N)
VLRDLHIKNLAVVADAAIQFGAGFNVVSGETGAGKSIVVDALALLAGARASSELIRSGAQTLTVTGVFAPSGTAWRACLDDVGIEPEGDTLVIRREISVTGNNRVFVNDQPATLRLVQMLAPFLLRIHGQNEELGLVAPDLQRTWLDRCGGAKGEALKKKVAAAFADWERLDQRIARRSGQERARHERADFLRFQLAELEDARIETGEEDSLRRERDLLRNAEEIRSALDATVGGLYDDDQAAYPLLSEAHRLIDAIARWESDAVAWATELDELRIRTNELAVTLRSRRDQLESDPRRLDEVEARLAVLERLMRKHGGTSAAVLERQAALRAELSELEADEADEEGLHAQAEAALGTYHLAAEALSAARAKWADGLAGRTRRELADLALGRARFEVDLEQRSRSASPLHVAGRAVEFSSHGFDQVRYRFSPNPGETMKTLAKAASGGELSRLYLAVQLASRGGRGHGPLQGATMVFDEVDAGIGGAEAAALGEKLRRLAAGGQILAVTHLPQVASRGDAHFKVSKVVRGGRTHTKVEHLEGDSRTQEVARMLAGSEITDLSLSHARELIAGAAG